MYKLFKSFTKNIILFENNKIRIIIDDDNDFWFNAKDTGKALGYAFPKTAINQMVDDRAKKYLEDINVKMPFGSQPKSVYLSEPGLYYLVFRSNKPSAIKFTEWVMYDLLPSINKYGVYKLKEEYEEKLKNARKKLHFVMETNESLQNNLKKNKSTEWWNGLCD